MTSSSARSQIKSFLAHPGFQRYFFNTGWMFAEKILRLIAGLFIGAYVARYLAPAQFGLLNYAISLTSIFSVAATLGLDTLIIRQLVADETRRNEVLGTAFRLRLTAAFIAFAAVTVIAFLTDPDPRTKVLVAIIAAGFFFEVFGIVDFFFQSRVQSKYTVLSQMAALSVISIFRVILVLNNASLELFAITYLLDFMVQAVGLTAFYRLHAGRLSEWKFNTSLAKAFLRDSWPLIVSSLSLTFYLRLGQIMVRWMLGDEAAGNYGVAVRLSEMWNFIPMAVCASLFPAIINAKKNSEKAYRDRLQSLYDLMVVISVSIALPMTFLSGFIVHFLFGETYQSASQIVVLYIWSGVFVFLGVANGKWILVENLQVFRMVILIITGGLNLILNYALIRLMGLPGAAVSTLISQAFACYFCFLLTAKTRIAFLSMTRSFNPFRLIRFFASRNEDHPRAQ